MPLISIIVPVYNVEAYLPQCIDSILAQTFTCFDLVLIDDGSEDGSGSICDEYEKRDKRVTVFHQKNAGQAVARNRGIDWCLKYSSSQWITFVDSDDWIQKDYLNVLYQAVEVTGAKLSCCLVSRSGDEMCCKTEKKQPKLYSAEALWVDCLEANSYSVAKLFHKTLLENIRFPEGRIFEDTATIHKLVFAVENGAFVNEYLYYYRTNPTSTLSNWSPRHLYVNDAHKAQIGFFKKKRYQRALKIAYIHHIGSLAKSADKLRGFPNYLWCRYLIIWELRWHLLVHSNLIRELPNDWKFYFSNAYPFLYSVCRFLTSRYNHLKELMKTLSQK